MASFNTIMGQMTGISQWTDRFWLLSKYCFSSVQFFSLSYVCGEEAL